MSTREEYDGPVIGFTISPWWAANAAKYVYFKAPEDWADMDEDGRTVVLDEALAEYVAENVEQSWSVYDSPEAAVQQTSGYRLGGRFSPDQLEEW